MNLGNNKVLITGGGSGIGLALAKLFTDAGSEVLITGRNEAKLIKACEGVERLSYHVADVTKQEDIESLKARIKGVGGLNLLINNAGVFIHKDYSKDILNTEELVREIDINYGGPVRMVDAFLPILSESKNPAIVNVSSGLAFVPLTAAPVYCGTKAALHSWTQSLRFQLSTKNIKVFELMPPLVATEMTKQYKEFKPISTDEFVTGFKKAFEKDTLEIVVGQSKGLRMMSRMAPKFIFKQLNKTFASK
ncbi:MAG: putative oxidoreductase [Crocinitomix sp.]|jgi:uncharacterized oxidoreductase